MVIPSICPDMADVPTAGNAEACVCAHPFVKVIKTMAALAISDRNEPV
jgi:hypothetical protein